MGPRSGPLAAFNAQGQVLDAWPSLRGSVDALCPDALGGFFLAGRFEDGSPTLLHIDATGKFEPGFRVEVSGTVSSLALLGDRLFVGGAFQSIAGQPVTHLAVLDARDGSVLASSPGADAAVHALAVAGGRVFAGGSFEQVGGQPQPYLAGFDSEGRLIADLPAPDAPVYALAGDAGSLVLAGDFSHVAGQARGRAAAISGMTLELLAWQPQIDGTVRALALGEQQVFIAGDFRVADGQPRSGLAAYHRAGPLVAWQPQVEVGSVLSLALRSEERLLVGGNFREIAGRDRCYLAELSTETGQTTSWQGLVSGPVRAVLGLREAPLAGGDFEIAGGLRRSNLVALDPLTGVATSWNPGTDGEVFVLHAVEDRLLVGGNFSEIASVQRSCLAAVTAGLGTAVDWFVDTNGGVRALAVHGLTVYVGGSFSQLNGVSRQGLGAANLQTGAVTGWNPGVRGDVWALARTEDALFAGGSFETPLAGVNNLARFDLRLGGGYDRRCALTDGSVSGLLVRGTQLVVGGDFHTLLGSPCDGLGLVDTHDLSAEAVAGWRGTITGLGSHDEQLWLSGWEDARPALALVSLADATLQRIASDGLVHCGWSDGQRLWLGGNFAQLAGEAQRGLARLQAEDGGFAASPAIQTARPLPEEGSAEHVYTNTSGRFEELRVEGPDSDEVFAFWDAEAPERRNPGFSVLLPPGGSLKLRVATRPLQAPGIHTAEIRLSGMIERVIPLKAGRAAAARIDFEHAFVRFEPDGSLFSLATGSDAQAGISALAEAVLLADGVRRPLNEPRLEISGLRFGAPGEDGRTAAANSGRFRILDGVREVVSGSLASSSLYLHDAGGFGVLSLELGRVDVGNFPAPVAVVMSLTPVAGELAWDSAWNARTGSFLGGSPISNFFLTGIDSDDIGTTLDTLDFTPGVLTVVNGDTLGQSAWADVNELGEATFVAGLHGAEDSTGVFFSDGTEVVRLLAESTVVGGITVRGFGRRPAINDSSRVAITMRGFLGAVRDLVIVGNPKDGSFGIAMIAAPSLPFGSTRTLPTIGQGALSGFFYREPATDHLVLSNPSINNDTATVTAPVNVAITARYTTTGTESTGIVFFNPNVGGFMASRLVLQGDTTLTGRPILDIHSSALMTNRLGGGVDHDTGMVAFLADVGFVDTDADTIALLVYHPESGIHVVAQEHDAIVDPNGLITGSFSSFYGTEFAISDDSTVVFVGDNGSGLSGIFHWRLGSGAAPLPLLSTAVSSSNGYAVPCEFGTGLFDDFLGVDVSDSATIAFTATVRNNLQDSVGVFLMQDAPTADRHVLVIASQGDNATRARTFDTTGVSGIFGVPRIGSMGHIGFYAQVTNPAVGYETAGVFVSTRPIGVIVKFDSDDAAFASSDHYADKALMLLDSRAPVTPLAGASLRVRTVNDSLTRVHRFTPPSASDTFILVTTDANGVASFFVSRDTAAQVDFVADCPTTSLQFGTFVECDTTRTVFFSNSLLSESTFGADTTVVLSGGVIQTSETLYLQTVIAGETAALADVDIILSSLRGSDSLSPVFASSDSAGLIVFSLFSATPGDAEVRADILLAGVANRFNDTWQLTLLGELLDSVARDAVDPDTLDFGSVVQGFTSADSLCALYFQKDTMTPVSLEAVGILGDTGNAFSIATINQHSPLGGTVALPQTIGDVAGESLSVCVLFTPPDVGIYRAFLVATPEDGVADTIVLQGTGTGNATLNARALGSTDTDSLDFGKRPMLLTPYDSLCFSVVRQGTGSATLVGLTLLGDASGAFSIDTLSVGLPRILGDPDLDSAIVCVAFNPADTLDYTAFVLVSSQQAGQTQDTIFLFGKGGPGILTAFAQDDVSGNSSDSLNFGTTQNTLEIKVSRRAGPQDTTVVLTGATILDDADGVFSIASISPILPATIDSAGDSATVSISYSSSLPGISTATLVLTGLQPHSSDTIYLVGEALGADLNARALGSVNSDTLDFGKAPVGLLPGDSLCFSVVKVGTGNSVLAGLSLLGDTANVFALDTLSVSLPHTLGAPATDSALVCVSFSPADTFSYSAMILVTPQDAGQTQDTLWVFGQGGPGVLKAFAFDTAAASSDSLDFGNRRINAAVDTLSIKVARRASPQDTTVVLTGATILGDSGGVFSVVSISPSLPATLTETGDSVTVRVAFTPNAAVTADAMLVFSGPQAYNADTIFLAGVGTDGALDALALEGTHAGTDSLFFDTRPLFVAGGDSLCLSVVRSAGDTLVSVQGLSIVGDSFNVFSVATISQSLPFALSTVGSADTLLACVQFVPTDTGLFSALLIVHPLEADVAPDTIILQGRGGEGLLSARANITAAANNDTLHFGTVRAGLALDTLEVRVGRRDLGNDTTAVMTGATIVGDSNGVFSVVSISPSLPATLMASNDSVTVRITYQPNAAGFSAAQLVLSAQQLYSSDTIFLAGTAEAGALAASPAALDFGVRPIGLSGGDSLCFAVTRVAGDTNVTVAGLTLVGDTGAFFIQSVDQSLPHLLGPGALDSVTVCLKFQPPDTGAFSALLVVASAQADVAPDTVMLSGFGGHGVLTARANVTQALSSDTLDFGTVRAGLALDTLEVRVGRRDLAGDTTSVMTAATILGDSNGVFSVVSISPSLPATLLATTDSVTVRITYQPNSAGFSDAQLVLTALQANGSDTIFLAGTAEAGALAASPAALDFGVRPIGLSGGDSLCFAVTRAAGDTNVTVAGLTLIGDTGAFFIQSIDQSLPHILGPNTLDSVTVCLKFLPPDTGAFSALLVVASAQADVDPDTVLLSGFGGHGVLTARANVTQALSSDTLDFGTVRAGLALDTLEVRVGRRDLPNDTTVVMTGATIVGDSNGVFSVVSIEPALKATLLAATDSVTVRITYQPNSAGFSDAQLVLVSATPTGFDTIQLVGRAEAGALAANPGALDFGVRPLLLSGGDSLCFAVTRAAGDTNVTVAGLTLIGDTSAFFIQSVDQSLPHILGPNSLDSVTVCLKFLPPDTGAFSAMVVVASAQADVPPDTVLLAGFGGHSVLAARANVTNALSSDTLDFGTVRAGLALDTLEVRVGRRDLSGDTTAVMTGATIFGDSNGVFSVVSISPSLPATLLAAADSVTVRITYQPNSAGFSDAQLVLTAQQPYSSDTIFLAGSAENGALAANPGALDFGVRPLLLSGGDSLCFAVTRASGDTNVTVAGLTLIGDTGAFFIQSVDQSLPHILGPGTLDSVTVCLKFLPPDTGAFSALVVVASGQPDVAPDTVLLSGFGGHSVLTARANVTNALSSDTLDFGVVRADFALDTLEVRVGRRDLSGDTTAVMTGATILGDSNGVFSVVSVSPSLPATLLAATDSVSVRITYQPNAAGFSDARLVLTAQQPYGADTIVLAGTAEAGALALSQTTLDFGTKPLLLGQGDSLCFAVTRAAGDTNVTVDGLTIVGDSHNVFTLDSISPSLPHTLAGAGLDSVAVCVHFLPADTGVFEALLVVSAQQDDVPAETVMLIGRGGNSVLEAIAFDNLTGNGPDTLDFQTVRADLALETLDVRVTRRAGLHGTTTVFSGATIHGDTVGVFSLISISPVLPDTLLSTADSVNLRLTFQPNDAGSYGALLVLTSPQPYSSDTVVLLGVAEGGALLAQSISAPTAGSDSLDFGNKPVGLSQADSLCVSVTRVGGDTGVTLTGLTIVGDSQNVFSLASIGPSLPHALGPNSADSVVVCVYFRPADTGEVRALLVVSAQEADVPADTIVLRGRGATGFIEARAIDNNPANGLDTLDFQTTRAGVTSGTFDSLCVVAQRRFSLGDSSVVLTGASIIDDSAGVFSLQTISSILPDTLVTAADSVQFCLTFHPLVEGSYSARLVLTGPQTYSQDTIVLVGLGQSGRLLARSISSPSVGSDSLVFGAVPLLTRSDSLCFSVRRVQGDTGVTVAGLSIVGDTTGVFSIDTVAPSLPHDLSGSDSLVACVSFRPSDTGRFEALLVVSAQQLDVPADTIRLVGVGRMGVLEAYAVDANAATGADTLDFELQRVGAPDSTIDSLCVVVKRRLLPGDTLVSLTGVSLHDDTAGVFSVVHLGAGLPSTFLTGNDSSVICLRFEPRDSVPYGAELVLTGPDARSSDTIKIVGQGQGGALRALSISAPTAGLDSLDFGDVKARRRSGDSLCISVVRTLGDTAVTLGGVSIIGDTAGVFSVQQLSQSLPYPLGPQASDSTIICLTFSPQDSLSYGALLVVSAQEFDVPADTIKLVGHGVRGVLVVEATVLPIGSLDFPNTRYGVASESLCALIRNVGDTNLVVDGASIVGSSPQNYTVSGISQPLPFVLGAQQSETICVVFTPLDTLGLSSHLLISTAEGESAGLTLTGQGLFADIVVSADTLLFGDVSVTLDSVLLVTVDNPGNDTLHLQQVRAFGTGFTVETAGFGPSIAPHASDTFAVRFTPAFVGSHTGLVEIGTLADTSFLQIVGLRGAGVFEGADSLIVTATPSGTQEGNATVLHVRVVDRLLNTVTNFQMATGDSLFFRQVGGADSFTISYERGSVDITNIEAGIADPTGRGFIAPFGPINNFVNGELIVLARDDNNDTNVIFIASLPSLEGTSNPVTWDLSSDFNFDLFIPAVSDTVIAGVETGVPPTESLAIVLRSGVSGNPVLPPMGTAFTAVIFAPNDSSAIFNGGDTLFLPLRSTSETTRFAFQSTIAGVPTIMVLDSAQVQAGDDERITVLPNDLDRFVVSVAQNQLTAGAFAQFSVDALDSFDNLIPRFTIPGGETLRILTDRIGNGPDSNIVFFSRNPVNVSEEDPPGAAFAASGVFNANGQMFFDMTDLTAESVQVRVELGSSNGEVGLRYVPGAPVASVIVLPNERFVEGVGLLDTASFPTRLSDSAGFATAAVPFDVSVRLVDANNNTVPISTGTARVALNPVDVTAGLSGFSSIDPDTLLFFSQLNADTIDLAFSNSGVATGSVAYRVAAVERFLRVAQIADTVIAGLSHKRSTVHEVSSLPAETLLIELEGARFLPGFGLFRPADTLVAQTQGGLFRVTVVAVDSLNNVDVDFNRTGYLFSDDAIPNLGQRQAAHVGQRAAAVSLLVNRQASIDVDGELATVEANPSAPGDVIASLLQAKIQVVDPFNPSFANAQFRFFPALNRYVFRGGLVLEDPGDASRVVFELGDLATALKLDSDSLDFIHEAQLVVEADTVNLTDSRFQFIKGLAHYSMIVTDFLAPQNNRHLRLKVDPDSLQGGFSFAATEAVSDSFTVKISTLTISRLTWLGDGQGRINQMELHFNQLLNPTALNAAVIERFGASLTTTGQVASGSGFNLSTVQADSTDILLVEDEASILTITLGTPLPTTDTANIVFAIDNTSGLVTDNVVSRNFEGIKLQASNFQPLEFHDGAPPVLIASETRDFDLDGVADVLVLVFSEDLVAVSLDIADLLVQGPNNQNWIEGMTSGDLFIQDNEILILLRPDLTTSGIAAPDFAFLTNGVLVDASGNAAGGLLTNVDNLELVSGNAAGSKVSGLLQVRGASVDQGVQTVLANPGAIVLDARPSLLPLGPFDTSGVTVSWLAPSGVSLSPNNSLRTEFNRFEPGTLQFRLIVQVNGGPSSNFFNGGADTISATVEVVVNNVPPTADAGCDRRVLRVGDPLFLDGSRSRDANRQDITFFAWDTAGIVVATAETATVSLPVGVHTLRLRVLDPVNPVIDGIDLVTVVVVDDLSGDTPPMADAGRDFQALSSSASNPQTVQLEGRASDDPDGTLTFHWTQLSGTEVTFDSTTAQPSFLTPSEPGILEFGLTVTSGGVTSPQDAVRVVVVSDGSDPRLPPIASGELFARDLTGDGMEETFGLVNTGTILSGDKSGDDEGLVSYSWRQLDGPQVILDRNGNPAVFEDAFQFFNFVPSLPGSYTFELLVVDDEAFDGLPDMFMVQILSPADTTAGLPRVEVRADTVASVGQSVSLVAASDDGLAAEQCWTQLRGPWTALRNAVSDSTVSFVPAQPGIYGFRVTRFRRDAQGAIFLLAIDEHEIAVSGTANAVPEAVISGAPTGTVGVGEEIALSARLSTDADADSLTLYWHQTLGAPVVLRRMMLNDATDITVTLEQPGTYVFELSAFDGQSWSRTVATTLVVANDAPAAVGGGGGGGGSCAVQPRTGKATPAAWLVLLGCLLAAWRPGRRALLRLLGRLRSSGLHLLGLCTLPLVAGCGLGSLLPLLFLSSGGGGTVDTSQPDDVGVLLSYAPVMEQSLVDGTIALPDSLDIRFALLNQGDDGIPEGRVVAFFLSADKDFNAEDDLRFLEFQVPDEIPAGTSAEFGARTGTLLPLSVIVRGPVFLIMQVNADDETELADADLNNVSVGEQPVQIYPQVTPTGVDPDFAILNFVAPTASILNGATNVLETSAVTDGVAEFAAVVTNLVEPVTTSVTLTVDIFLSDDTTLSSDDDSLSVSIQGGSNNFVFPQTTKISDSLRVAGIRVDLPSIAALGSDESPARRFFLMRLRSNLGDENSENNTRTAEHATFIYDQWLQATNGAILPSTNAGDPIALSAVELRPEIENELLPTGRQRLLSFEIPERDLTPEQSQILLICSSQSFDPILEIFNPSGKGALARDDSDFGNASALYLNVASLGSNRTFFIAVSSFDNVGGTFDMIVDINPREPVSGAGGNELPPPVVVPHLVGNLLELERVPNDDGVEIRRHPFQVTQEENEFLVFVPANVALGLTIVNGVNLLLEAGLNITFAQFVANQNPVTALVDIVPSGNDLIVKPQGATELFFSQEPGFLILVLESGVPAPGSQSFELRFDYLFFRDDLGTARFDELSEALEQARN